MSLRERIIHESLRLFSLKGFLSTSINDILEAANTSKGGFYNHFASKEELFFEVLDEARRIGVKSVSRVWMRLKARGERSRSSLRITGTGISRILRICQGVVSSLLCPSNCLTNVLICPKRLIKGSLVLKP